MREVTARVKLDRASFTLPRRVRPNAKMSVALRVDEAAGEDGARGRVCIATAPRVLQTLTHRCVYVAPANIDSGASSLFKRAFLFYAVFPPIYGTSLNLVLMQTRIGEMRS